jgi:hypothetical protein
MSSKTNKPVDGRERVHFREDGLAPNIDKIRQVIRTCVEIRRCVRNLPYMSQRLIRIYIKFILVNQTIIVSGICKNFSCSSSTQSNAA